MFKLQIAITRATVDAMKADMTKSLPDVKSCHRIEAMARGFGFNTYAAMRTATEGAATAGQREASGVAFGSYLASHGFAVDTSVFHRVVGRIALREVLASEPLLTFEGFGAGDRRRNKGVWETMDDRERRIEESRARFASSDVEQFLRALAFVSLVKPIKRIDKGADSYGMKHIAEKISYKYPEGQNIKADYVSNGTMIAAAIHAGFSHKKLFDGWGELRLTAVFAMSPRSIRELSAIVREKERLR